MRDSELRLAPFPSVLLFSLPKGCTKHRYLQFHRSINSAPAFISKNMIGGI